MLLSRDSHLPSQRTGDTHVDMPSNGSGLLSSLALKDEHVPSSVRRQRADLCSDLSSLSFRLGSNQYSSLPIFPTRCRSNSLE